MELCLHTLRADCNIIVTREQDAQILCLHTLRADCNKSAEGISGKVATLPPHAPCRLQRLSPFSICSTMSFASTRSVQIATENDSGAFRRSCFASTRSVQIATYSQIVLCSSVLLCLHTLRADCNVSNSASICLMLLCLHTLRADCNRRQRVGTGAQSALPPHAPCRLQPPPASCSPPSGLFASTRSVQIATHALCGFRAVLELCLHTLRADCNDVPFSWAVNCPALPPHAPCRLQL